MELIYGFRSMFYRTLNGSVQNDLHLRNISKYFYNWKSFFRGGGGGGGGCHQPSAFWTKCTKVLMNFLQRWVYLTSNVLHRANRTVWATFFLTYSGSCFVAWDPHYYLSDDSAFIVWKLTENFSTDNFNVLKTTSSWANHCKLCKRVKINHNEELAKQPLRKQRYWIG